MTSEITNNDEITSLFEVFRRDSRNISGIWESKIIRVNQDPYPLYLYEWPAIGSEIRWKINGYESLRSYPVTSSYAPGEWICLARMKNRFDLLCPPRSALYLLQSAAEGEALSFSSYWDAVLQVSAALSVIPSELIRTDCLNLEFIFENPPQALSVDNLSLTLKRWNITGNIPGRRPKTLSVFRVCLPDDFSQ